MRRDSEISPTRANLALFLTRPQIQPGDLALGLAQSPGQRESPDQCTTHTRIAHPPTVAGAAAGARGAAPSWRWSQHMFPAVHGTGWGASTGSM